MNGPLVSVIVASYNYEKFIGEALASILNQSYAPFEVIVVDDGSKDNSVDVIKHYASKDSRIRFCQHENGENKGLSESIKLALSLAKGTWIAFCESDDYWHKDYFVKKIDYALLYPEAVIITNKLKMFGDTAEIKYRETRLKRFFDIILKDGVPKDVFFDLYGRNILPTFSAVMVRRDVLEACDFNAEIAPWLDWWLWRQIAFEHKIGGINEELTFWRVHGGSYNNLSDKGRATSKRFKKAHNKLLKKKYGRAFDKKIIKLLPKFLVQKIKKKSLRVEEKQGYIRVSLLGIRICKIKKKNK